MAESTYTRHSPLPGFNIRQATSDDADAMADLFFTSFTPSHPIWPTMIKVTPLNRAWWSAAWRLGIEKDPTTLTFVVEDTAAQNKLVGFSRWIVPQPDGNLVRLWPDLTEDFDLEISHAFFGGMEVNRHELMGTIPHWMLEMLGVDQGYQRRGIGNALISWGLRKADEDRLESYLDASMMGLPFYERRGFQLGKLIELPKRPEYGEFVYTSVVRFPK